MSRALLPDAAIVVITSFSFACLAFILTVTLVIPVTAAFGAALGVPDVATQGFVMTELVFIPIAAAVLGIDVGASWAKQTDADA